MGFLLLEGGAEFGGAMSEPDVAALRLAGGLGAPIAILPAAAAPDHNHGRAGRNALAWFRSLGALNAEVIPVIDAASAGDPALAEMIRRARLIYMLGGFPRYLAETLRGSRAWEAVLQAHEAGAVVGGSSAGAMVLCEHYYDPESGQVQPGLNMLANICILPHHNGFGHTWAPRLLELLPRATLVGIDERTGIVNAEPDQWSVHGSGQVTFYRSGNKVLYGRGATFQLAEHPSERLG